ncbi:hypothetical protein J6590_085568 [Homalodisca vitripennis]|nr:hypothetical protein J6590_085568 [Homalodisca vitripennis]
MTLEDFYQWKDFSYTRKKNDPRPYICDIVKVKANRGDKFLTNTTKMNDSWQELHFLNKKLKTVESSLQENNPNNHERFHYIGKLRFFKILCLGLTAVDVLTRAVAQSHYRSRVGESRHSQRGAFKAGRNKQQPAVFQKRCNTRVAVRARRIETCKHVSSAVGARLVVMLSTESKGGSKSSFPLPGDVPETIHDQKSIPIPELCDPNAKIYFTVPSQQ